MTVYLLHFSQPFKHAKHYMGFAEDIDTRLERHRAGNGSRLIAVITQAGIDFELARTWVGDRALERKLKQRKDAPRLCPICDEKAMSRGNYTAKEREQKSRMSSDDIPF